VDGGGSVSASVHDVDKVEESIVDVDAVADDSELYRKKCQET